MSAEQRINQHSLRIPRAADGALRLSSAAARPVVLAERLATKTQPPGAITFGAQLMRRFDAGSAPGAWAANLAQRFVSGQRALPEADLPMRLRRSVEPSTRQSPRWPSASLSSMPLQPSLSTGDDLAAATLLGDLSDAGWTVSAPAATAARLPADRLERRAPPVAPGPSSAPPPIARTPVQHIPFVAPPNTSADTPAFERTQPEIVERAPGEPDLLHTPERSPAGAQLTERGNTDISNVPYAMALQAPSEPPVHLVVNRSIGLIKPAPPDPLARMGLELVDIGRFPAVNKRPTTRSTLAAGVNHINMDTSAAARSTGGDAMPQARRQPADPTTPAVAASLPASPITTTQSARVHSPLSYTLARRYEASSARLGYVPLVLRTWSPTMPPVAETPGQLIPIEQHPASADSPPAERISATVGTPTTASGAQAGHIDRLAVVPRPAIVPALPLSSGPAVPGNDGPSTAVPENARPPAGADTQDWGALPLVHRLASRQALALNTSWAAMPQAVRLTSMAAHRGTVQSAPATNERVPTAALSRQPDNEFAADSDAAFVDWSAPGPGTRPRQSTTEMTLPYVYRTSGFDSPPPLPLAIVRTADISDIPHPTSRPVTFDRPAADGLYGATMPLDLAQSRRATDTLSNSGDVQRALSDQPVAAGAPAGDMPAGPASTPAGPSVEEIARKVYDHIRDRLWIEHERRGRTSW